MKSFTMANIAKTMDVSLTFVCNYLFNFDNF